MTGNVRRAGGVPLGFLALVAGLVLAVPGDGAVRAQAPVVPHTPSAIKLYVFDCGTLDGVDRSRFRLRAEEIATTRMSVACFLVVHPRGSLMWDAGAVPDTAWTPTGKPVTQRIVLPDTLERVMTVVTPLGAQLAQVGHPPGSITFFALSHYHWDHTANADQFAGATWLVRQAERDGMFPEKPPGPGLTQPATYGALRTSRTVIIKNDEHDVFADGTVVIKLAAGHTPGHQVLYVKLARTGGVVVSGDLYHYPEERALNRVPTFEFDQNQTRAARAVIDAFLKKTGAQLWIQHDFTGNAKLKKAPAYYD